MTSPAVGQVKLEPVIQYEPPKTPDGWHWSILGKRWVGGPTVH